MTSLLQKINELDSRIDNINISGGGDTTALQAQIDTNTTDISGIQTSKQNTLIAGDNITITGDTISSSAGGSGGTIIDSTTDLSCSTLTTVGDINIGGIIKAPNQIRFRAHRGGSIYNANARVRLPYNLIYENVGGGYNNTTYTYTVPVAGAYYFYATMYSNFSDNFVCDIFVNNNNNIIERVEKGSNFNLALTKFAGQGTQYCNVGDEVYVYNLVGNVGLYTNQAVI